MKFLIFNIAVVTALGFLFFGNPADIQQASNKVVRAVEGIKEKTTYNIQIINTKHFDYMFLII